MPHSPRLRRPHFHRPPGRRGTRAAAPAVVAGLCVVALAGCSAIGPGDDPGAVVQRFITASSVQGNGAIACTFLTFAEQRAVSPPGSHEGCRQAMNAGGLVLGGDAIASDHALHELTVHTKTDGDRAWVRVSRDGRTASFELVRADSAELSEFEAPNTNWRIARGAPLLVDHPAAAAPLPAPAT